MNTGASNREQPAFFEGWHAPRPLMTKLPTVLPLSPEILPGQLRDWVQDIAERMNCPIDLVAIPAMVAAGSLIGRKVGSRRD